MNENSNYSLSNDLKSLKSVDRRLENAINPAEIVPVHGDGKNALYGPGYYKEDTVIPVVEKYTHTGLLGSLANVVAPLTTEDVKIMKDKEYVATLYDFDNWVVNKYLQGLPLNEPEKRDWLRQVYPEFFERQVEAVKAIHDMKAKYDKLCVEGAKTIEDMYFMYMFEKENLIDFSTSSPQSLAVDGLYTNIESVDNTFAENSPKAFERGVFNTRERFLKLYNEAMLAGWPNPTGALWNNTIPDREYDYPRRWYRNPTKQEPNKADMLPVGKHLPSVRRMKVNGTTRPHIHGFTTAKQKVEGGIQQQQQLQQLQLQPQQQQPQQQMQIDNQQQSVPM